MASEAGTPDPHLDHDPNMDPDNGIPRSIIRCTSDLGFINTGESSPTRKREAIRKLEQQTLLGIEQANNRIRYLERKRTEMHRLATRAEHAARKEHEKRRRHEVEQAEKEKRLKATWTEVEEKRIEFHKRRLVHLQKLRQNQANVLNHVDSRVAAAREEAKERKDKVKRELQRIEERKREETEYKRRQNSLALAKRKRAYKNKAATNRRMVEEEVAEGERRLQKLLETQQKLRRKEMNVEKQLGEVVTRHQNAVESLAVQNPIAASCALAGSSAVNEAFLDNFGFETPQIKTGRSHASSLTKIKPRHIRVGSRGGKEESTPAQSRTPSLPVPRGAQPRASVEKCPPAGGSPSPAPQAPDSVNLPPVRGSQSRPKDSRSSPPASGSQELGPAVVLSNPQSRQERRRKESSESTNVHIADGGGRLQVAEPCEEAGHSPHSGKEREEEEEATPHAHHNSSAPPPPMLQTHSSQPLLTFGPETANDNNALVPQGSQAVGLSTSQGTSQVEGGATELGLPDSHAATTNQPVQPSTSHPGAYPDSHAPPTNYLSHHQGGNAFVAAPGTQFGIATQVGVPPTNHAMPHPMDQNSSIPLPSGNGTTGTYLQQQPAGTLQLGPYSSPNVSANSYAPSPMHPQVENNHYQYQQLAMASGGAGVGHQQTMRS
eukprot:Rmarinus@m.19110